MSSVSTFGTFTTARLGIYVSQKALDVVGNNIANINTVGYTRQSYNQKSMYAGAADRYRTPLDARVGNGALITNITQLRDPYLDIRYRNEQSSVGSMEAKLNGLGQLADILDEVGKGEDGEGVVEAQFNDLIKQVQNHNTIGAGLDTYDTLVRKASSALVDTIHSYASRLETLMKNQRTGFDQDLENVNTILRNIRDLNVSIRKSNIFGGDALEQKDERNNLIDELSKYVRVDVTYEMEDIGEGKPVEKLVIKLAGGNAVDDKAINNATLVDGVYATQLSVAEDDEDLMVSLAPLTDNRDRTMQVLATSTKAVSDKETADKIADAVKNAAGATDGEKAASIRSTLEKWIKDNPAKFSASKEMTGKEFEYSYQVAQGKDGWSIERTMKSFSTGVTLGDNTLYGGLQAERELLTEQGEYATDKQMAMDPNASNKRGIRYYMKALDTLANQFANIMNEANKAMGGHIYGTAPALTEADEVYVGDYLQIGGKTYEVKGAAAGDKLTKDQRTALANMLKSGKPDLKLVEEVELPKGYEPPDDGPLFSNNGDENTTAGITASNISISKDWADGVVRIQQSKDPHHTSTDNSNISHILNLLQGDHDFTPDGADLSTGSHLTGSGDEVFFSGTFQEMYTENMVGILGADYMTTNTMLDNYSTSADELYVERDSVSGVDLNDEAMNMIQYQKSYSAACRLMTTIDEVLDKLINGTGRAGL